LQLGEGEFDALQQEHQILANLDATRQRLQSALQLLQDDEHCAADLVAQASRQLRDAATVDRRLEDAAEQLASAEDLIADVCRKVQSGLARLDLDPARLHDVEARLDAVQTALRRFGPTETDFRRTLAATQEELQRLDGGQGDPTALAQALQLAVTQAA